MKQISYLAAAAVLAASVAGAQTITLPPNGDNQRASVTQGIGPVLITIDYNSPDVHLPDGTDRRGKIYGTDVVHYGLTNLGFGTCTECPWRAGANENTVLTASHDVLVEGRKLPAGRYGLQMIAGPEEWTLILSKDADSWGSFFYDPANDALRVKVKPAKSAYHEWLTYEFTERRPDRARVVMRWEEVEVPFTIAVEDIGKVYLSQIRRELLGQKGFSWQNWNAAAAYALANGGDPKEALAWAQTSVSGRFVGQENFQTLMTLADAQSANGLEQESNASRQLAFNHPTANPGGLHQYARGLVARGKGEEALAVWQLSAKRFGTVWPVNVGLARGYSAVGRYEEALEYARLALAQAPDDLNRRFLEEAIEGLRKGEDMNR